MNKLLISIIASSIIAAGIDVYFVLEKPAFAEPQKKPTISQERISKDSPFGASGALSRPFIESDKVSQEEVIRRTSEVKELYTHVQDIGVKWVRPGADIYWRLVQPTNENIQNGLFNWKPYDDIHGRVPPGVNILGTIDALAWGTNLDPVIFKPGTWVFASAEAEKSYIRFVKETVERFDGDGYKDMPGLKNPIKYWQIGNEPALRPLAGIKDFDKSPDWKGYSHLVEITCKAIKDVDPQAKVALAGLASGGLSPDDQRGQREREEFYVPILQNLHGKYIDIFDIHCYAPPNEWKGIKNIYAFIRQKLDENGYQHTEIWITETAVPSKPFGEILQAINLIKSYVYPLSFGVKKVFWWNMIEGEPPIEGDQSSNHFGLVYDGIGQGDPGYGIKKLSYYTYKKMIEVLEGSDWNNIKAIKEEQNDAYGLFLYKFTRNGKPVYVGWFDCFDEQKCSVIRIDLRAELSFDRDVKTIKITEAVPKYKSGKEVADYSTAFNSEIKSADGGKITIALKKVPVIAEELK